MKKNILLNQFFEDPRVGGPIVRRLRQQPWVGEVYEWTYDQRSGVRSYSAPQLQQLTEPSLFENFFVDENRFGVQEYQIFFRENFYVFEAMLVKMNLRRMLTPYEASHIFRIYYLYWKNFFRTRSIHIVITETGFFSGYDWIMLRLAKHMGLSIFICDNIFSTRFFWTTEWSDWGKFDKAASLFPKVPSLKYRGSGVLANRPDVISFVDFGREKHPISRLTTFFHHMASGDAWRALAAYSLQKYYQSRSLDRVWKHTLHDRPQAGRLDKYVFYPLHYQPEATTVSHAPEWRNQLDALELVREITPSDIPVVVKEHWAQAYGGPHRDKLFFQRLNSIPGLTFADPHARSDTLIGQATCVATLAGSAGFEAVSSGVPALIFGSPWYRFLPGIVPISAPNLSWELVLSSKPKPERVDAELSEMTSRMGIGLLNDGYLGGADILNDYESQSFSSEINAQNVIESIETIFRHLRFI